MTEFHGRLETQSHADSMDRWFMTERAQRQLVETVVGKPVRVNFKGQMIGRVVSARIEDDGPHAVLYVAEALRDLVPKHHVLGPAFAFPFPDGTEDFPRDEDGRRKVDTLTATEVSFVPKEDSDGTQ